MQWDFASSPLRKPLVHEPPKMRSTAEQSGGKLNQLNRLLPQGMLVDAAWLEQHGYSTSQRSQYVSSGWLERPAYGVYMRPLGSLTWERVIASLQHLMERPLHVGGRTALELVEKRRTFQMIFRSISGSSCAG
jgi:hypothetical protein